MAWHANDLPSFTTIDPTQPDWHEAVNDNFTTLQAWLDRPRPTSWYDEESDLPYAYTKEGCIAIVGNTVYAAMNGIWVDIGTPTPDHAVFVERYSLTSDGGKLDSTPTRRLVNVEEEDQGDVGWITATPRRIGLYGPGNYWIEASAPAHQVLTHVIQLYNATSGEYALTGQPAYSYTTNVTQTRSVMSGLVSIDKDSLFYVHHRVQHLNSNSNAQGEAISPAGIGYNYYCVVEVWRM